jgi:hypothetical protein
MLPTILPTILPTMFHPRSLAAAGDEEEDTRGETIIHDINQVKLLGLLAPVYIGQVARSASHVTKRSMNPYHRESTPINSRRVCLLATPTDARMARYNSNRHLCVYRHNTVRDPI